MNIIDVKKGNTQHYLDWVWIPNLFWLIRSIILILWVLQKINCWILIWWARVNFDTSTFHLLLAHVFSSISETIHVNPLITTIKKNKIVSLLFNVGLNIFTTFHLPYSLSHLYIYVITLIHFNYLILKYSNREHAMAN